MKNSILKFFVAGSLIGIAALCLTFFFKTGLVEGSSFGIDWHGIWLGLRGGVPRYGMGLRNPPWSIILLLPLGLLSFELSWAILTLATVAAEVVSVPPKSSKHVDWWVIIFITTSYPSLRNIADGNLEILPIFGSLIMLFAYQRQELWPMVAGLLLASGKPQATWLLIIVFSLFLIKTWPRTRYLYLFLVVFTIVTSTLVLSGDQWIDAILSIEARGSIVDIGLISTFSRLGMPSIITGVIWTILLLATLYIAISTGASMDRNKAGLLISASLLLSPYAAGNSLLTVVALGVVPLFRVDLKSAIAMGILINLPYIAIGRTHILSEYGTFYTSGVLVFTWFVFAWKTRIIGNLAFSA